VDIALTGSSGLIGTALTRQLEAQGHRVIRVVRSASNKSGGGDQITWDINAGTIDVGGLEGIDGVVHLAGEGIAEKRWSDEQKAKILDSRTKGTSLLSEALAALNRPPKRFLSGSAIGFYGDRGAEVLTETSASGDDFLAEVCRKWEAATEAAEAAGIQVAHLRTGIVLSTDGGALDKQLPLFKLGLGGRIGDGTQYLSWISIDDQVAAIIHLLTSTLTGPVNLTGPNPVTNAEFTKALGEAANRPTILPIPSFGPRLLLGKELAEALLHTSARVEPAALMGDGFVHSSSTIDEALSTILS